jgi:hypothetical protein
MKGYNITSMTRIRFRPLACECMWILSDSTKNVHEERA